MSVFRSTKPNLLALSFSSKSSYQLPPLYLLRPKMMEPASTTKELQGKVAIVTGSTSGIGEAAARLFTDHGALLVIADIQDEKGLQVARSIGSHRCRLIHCDVADDDQVDQGNGQLNAPDLRPGRRHVQQRQHHQHLQADSPSIIGSWQ
ncbi:hypothetical protein LguiA_007329 [Lonicera macranthoides]